MILRVKGSLTLNPLNIVFLCFLVLLAADLGLFSGFDASILAFCISIIIPEASPFLLLTLTSVQDAPGMSGISWYLGLLLVGSKMMFFRLLSFMLDGSNFKLSNLNLLAIVATSIVLFSVIVSGLNEVFDWHAQSDSRNPFLLGFLIVFMIWLGVTSAKILEQIPQITLNKSIIYLVLLLIVHGIGVGLLQVFMGPEFLTSTLGREVVDVVLQLTQSTALGIPRIHAAFLSPNAFALCMSLIFLVLLATTQEKRLSMLMIFWWFFLGVVVCFLSQSKAMIVFYLMTGTFMLLQARAWGLIIFLLLASMALGSIVISSDGILDAFRIQQEAGGESYRTLSWLAVIHYFTWYDWLTGVGLSYWPTFFEAHMGVPLAGPHTWVLSFPGTYGVPGLIFFIVVMVFLFKHRGRRNTHKRALVSVLLVLFLVKDLVSMSYLLSNTPFTFLIWMLIGLLMSPNLPYRYKVLLS